jgi:hypothetical protein
LAIIYGEKNVDLIAINRFIDFFEKAFLQINNCTLCNAAAIAMESTQAKEARLSADLE